MAPVEATQAEKTYKRAPYGELTKAKHYLESSQVEGVEGLLVSDCRFFMRWRDSLWMQLGGGRETEPVIHKEISMIEFMVSARSKLDDDQGVDFSPEELQVAIEAKQSQLSALVSEVGTLEAQLIKAKADIAQLLGGDDSIGDLDRLYFLEDVLDNGPGYAV